jgi:hypothetical protein
MANEPVNDGFITADFIGGIWDGKTYDIPFIPEFRIAVMKERIYINKPPQSEMEKSAYDIAVYKYIGHGAYMMNRIEKNG